MTQSIFLKARTEYLSNPTKCSNPKCLIILPFEKRKNLYCSNSCSATIKNSARTRTNISKERISLSLKATFKKNKKLGIIRPSNKGKSVNTRQPLYGVPVGGPYTKLDGYISCKCCGKMFWATKLKITCSPECYRKNSTYRKIVHEYEHNGEILKLESSWEVDIAKWLDSNNFEWDRPKHIKWTDSNGKARKYFPDFYLPKYDLYLDPKNTYQIKIGKEKLEVISKSINLIYGEVKYIKDYILTL